MITIYGFHKRVSYESKSKRRGTLFQKRTGVPVKDFEGMSITTLSTQAQN